LRRLIFERTLRPGVPIPRALPSQGRLLVIAAVRLGVRVLALRGLRVSTPGARSTSRPVSG
jgi:hypothetical protein